MRSLMFLLVLVLFCSVPMTSSAPFAFGVHSNCCMELTNVKIPVKLVKSFYWTSSTCPRQAIVFQMISGKEFCVDPEATWVKGHVAKVDKRTTTTKTTTTAATTETTSAATAATTAKTQSPTVSRNSTVPI